MREGRTTTQDFNEFKSHLSKNWLLTLEVLELIKVSDADQKFINEVETQLQAFKKDKDLQKLVDDGIKIIEQNTLAS